MTDTTDIAQLISAAISLTEKVMAARGVAEIDRAAVAASGFVAKGLLTDLVELLEAERQRADLATRQNEGINNNLRRRAVRAEAELAALKGEQVPVAVVELNDNLTVAEIRGDIPRRKAVRELYEGALVLGQELFTAPQKPVFPGELREDILRCVDDSMHGCNSLSAPDYAVRVAGWLAVGGIVKDGE